MGTFLSGVVVVMSVGWVGPNLETELAELRNKRHAGGVVAHDDLPAAEERPGKPVVAVSIHRFVVTDAILERLVDYGDLEELRLEDSAGSGWEARPFPPWRVTDTGIAHLKALKHLRVLSIPTPTITDAGLAHLGAMAQLQELTLGNGNITNAGFSHLKDLRSSIHSQSTGPASPIQDSKCSRSSPSLST